MPLHPTSARRERILIMGPEGAGKSRTRCSLAAWLRRTQSPARMYVLDSDMASEAMADGFPGFYDNTEVYDAYEWGEFKDSLARAMKDSDPTRGDWLVVDVADRAWTAVQDWYQEEVVQRDVENWMIEHARALEQASTEKERNLARQHPLSGEWGMNWFYVNNLYQKWFMPVIRWKGHVMLIAHEKKLVRDGDRADDKELQMLYAKVGVRPEGQKGLSLPMHTILRLTDSVDARGKHDRRITTVKDRERRELVNEPISDFVTDYMLTVAGWEA
jgi:energy-coupling factor transporter ATP-binding protein EcfA2